MTAPENPYDEVPYPSQAIWQSHPARLAAIASLFGMRPAPADRCRVLEMGCGTGGNLIPMAERLPESSFVGIDYSQVQIDAACQTVDTLGLKNLELRHASILDLGDELGTFDYILCHGVYSWVPRDVQDKILDYCRAALEPRGIAYVSYNVYPGWHLRAVIRRLLCGQLRGTAAERIASARNLLELLARTVASSGTPFQTVLKTELDAILRQQGAYVFHEYLERDNEPLYFHHFAERAAAAGLQYLGDASSAAYTLHAGPAVEDHLRRLTGDDAIAVEQHMDVLHNSGFRLTLLCRPEVTVSRQVLPERLEGLYFSGKFIPENPSPDLRAPREETFTTRKGRKVKQSAPLVKAALYHFGSAWPRNLSIDELTEGIEGLIAAGGAPLVEPEKLRSHVVGIVSQCLAFGIVDPSTLPDGFTLSPGERPVASGVARWQAHGSNSVCNRRHEQVRLDDAARAMLPYLDGTHDHAALVAQLRAGLRRGEVTLPPGFAAPGVELSDELLTGAVGQWLTSLAAQALLIA